MSPAPWVREPSSASSGCRTGWSIWSSAVARTAGAALFPALLLALLLAAGCGFEPVHGGAGRESAHNQDASHESARHDWLANLRAARLQVPQSAVGWQLGRFLRAHQSGANAPGTKVPVAANNGGWRLTVGLSLGRDDLLLQRDSHVIRGAVRLQGRYALLDDAGEELLSGSLRVSAAYNRAGGGFANEIALRNAEERAAREFAEQLWHRLRLAGAKP